MTPAPRPARDLSDLRDLTAEVARAMERPETLSRESLKEMVGMLRASERILTGERYFELFPATGPLRRELYGKTMTHFAMGKLYLERMIMAGNRTGKTENGAFETVAHTTGVYRDWWVGRTFDHPIRAWACGKTNETTEEIVMRKLFGRAFKSTSGTWLPDCTGMFPRQSVVLDSLRWRNGYPGLLNEVDIRYRDSRSEFSTLKLKAYEQGRGVFEGTAQHWIWLDEEPPQDVYAECLTRLLTTGGLLVITYTPLDGMTKVTQEFMPPDLQAVESGIGIESGLGAEI